MKGRANRQEIQHPKPSKTPKPEAPNPKGPDRGNRTPKSQTIRPVAGVHQPCIAGGKQNGKGQGRQGQLKKSLSLKVQGMAI